MIITLSICLFTIFTKAQNASVEKSTFGIQTGILKSLLDKSRLLRLTTSSTRFNTASYALTDMMDDLRKGLFSELATQKATDVFRRNLQKVYVSQLGDIINPAPSSASAANPFMPSVADVKNTDVVSEAKAQLKKLAASIKANKGSIADATTVNHLDDLQDRIKEILDPK